MSLSCYFNGQYDVYEVKRCIMDAFSEIRRRAPECWAKKRVIEVLEKYVLKIENEYFEVEEYGEDEDGMYLSCDICKEINIHRNEYKINQYDEWGSTKCYLQFLTQSNYPGRIRINLNTIGYWWHLRDSENHRFVDQEENGADIVIFMRENRVSSFNIAEIIDGECQREDRIRVIVK